MSSSAPVSSRMAARCANASACSRWMAPLAPEAVGLEILLNDVDGDGIDSHSLLEV
jgi:hypothetical protein